MIERGDWVVSDVARNAFDVEGKVVGRVRASENGTKANAAVFGVIMPVRDHESAVELWTGLTARW